MKREVLLMAAAMFSADAGAQEFPSREQARDYIVATLPKATADNPKYLTKADGTWTQWLTDDVVFADGGAALTMHERSIATKAGAPSEVRHVASFALADVTVGPYREPGDVTPSGEAAIGLEFACKAPQCVAAIWGETPSRADRTDLYVQDPATRDRLLAAFRRLSTP